MGWNQQYQRGGKQVHIDGVGQSEIQGAQICLKMAQKAVPEASVGIAEAVKTKMTQWQKEGLTAAGLPNATVHCRHHFTKS